MSFFMSQHLHTVRDIAVELRPASLSGSMTELTVQACRIRRARPGGAHTIVHDIMPTREQIRFTHFYALGVHGYDTWQKFGKQLIR